MADRYTDPARAGVNKKPRRRNSKTAGLAALNVLLALVLVGLILTAWQLETGAPLDGMLKMGDVTIGGIHMEGMSKRQAKETLASFADTCAKDPMVITVLDTTVTLTPQQVGYKADTDAAVDQAYRDKATGEFDLLPYLGVDTEVVHSAVEELGKKYNQEFSETVATITGSQPDLAAPPAEGEAQEFLTVVLGKPEYGLDTQLLYQQVLQAYNSLSLSVIGACSQLEPGMPDLDALYLETFIPPVDAVMDPATFQITPEVYGYCFDLEAAKAQLEQAQYGETVVIPFNRITPEATAETLGGHLFRDVLGEAQTPYKGSDTNSRNTNLALACAAINGKVLLPGEVFAYNAALGERTEEAGYKPAPTYVGDMTVDTIGGGICQISSTLYYSTLFADLEIVERYNHGFKSDYIDLCMDATVTWGGADFRFRNNTNYPIRIEASRADGFVTIRIIGTDERDYYVKMTYEILSTTKFDTVYEEMPADNEKGYKDGATIVTPYTGYIAKAYKEKYSKETDELISREEESYNVYKKRDWVKCKIVETPTTEATTPESTDPTGENELPETGDNQTPFG